jgi:hypothetical protein
MHPPLLIPFDKVSHERKAILRLEKTHHFIPRIESVPIGEYIQNEPPIETDGIDFYAVMIDLDGAYVATG